MFLFKGQLDFLQNYKNCRHNVEVVSNIVYKGHAFHFYNAALAGDV